MRRQTSQKGSPLDQRLSRFLAWFGLGLGVPQLTRPDLVNRLIGVRDDAESRRWQRIVGAREVAAWAGILLTQPRPAPWLWARVAGDIKDLALLGTAYGNKRENTAGLTAATASVAGITALDLYTAMKTSSRERTTEEGGHMRVKAAITVRQPPAEAFVVWENVENFPIFMEHLDSVTTTGPRRSRWTAQGPGGRDVEWDVEVFAVTPNEIIEWRSVEGSGIETSGIARFTPAPGMRGTEVRLEMEYDSRGGKLGEVIAKLLGEDPTQQVKDDLRRFKQLLETGEIVRSDATPEGTGARGLIKQRPAQPIEDDERAVVTAGGSAS